MRSMSLAFVLVVLCSVAPSIYADDEYVKPHTLMSEWPLERADIVVSYSLNDQGVGSLTFRDVGSNKLLAVNYLENEDKDVIQDLHVVGMQSFNEFFVLTLETAVGFLVEAFLYDDKSKVVNQVVSDGGRAQPEFIYYGQFNDPAIGVLSFTNDSRLTNRLVCGEVVYMLNKRNHRIEIHRVRGMSHGNTHTRSSTSFSCEQ